ncbi:MAG: hypothetical protein U0797_23875 [Gemmataceae bacterium]
MTRAMGMLCAALVIVSIGCALNVGNTRVDVAVKGDVVGVDATLEEVAVKVKTELERRGLQVAVSSEGDAVRVVSTTKTGDKFTVVLSRGRAPSKFRTPVREQTQVRVEWEKAPDHELWEGLVATLLMAAVSPAK